MASLGSRDSLSRLEGDRESPVSTTSNSQYNQWKSKVTLILKAVGETNTSCKIRAKQEQVGMKEIT